MENFCLSEELTNRARKPDHISFSSFKIFNQCPHKFYLMKVVNAFPYLANEHTILGSGVHGVMEYVFNCKKDGVQVQSSNFLNVYREVAEKEVASAEKNGNPMNESQLLKIFSVDNSFLKSVVSNVLFDVGDVAENFLIEEQINYPLNFLVEDTDITFEYHIDLSYDLYGKKVIRDWKTASKLWDEAKQSDFWGTTAQLLLYKFFLHKQKDIAPQDIRTIYSIFKKTKAYRVQHWEATYSQGQVREMLERIRAMVVACEEMKFERTYQCVDYAGFQGAIMCPAFDNKELCDGCKKNIKAL